jgi:hypothetical protein
MKKLLFIFAIVGILLTMSCDDTPEEVNPFIGTWENEFVRNVFTETEITQFQKIDDSITWSGTYTYNDTEIIMIMEYRTPPYDDLELYPNPRISPYRFENGTLLMGYPIATVFTKVPD